jgi:hypothetical protein
MFRKRARAEVFNFAQTSRAALSKLNGTGWLSMSPERPQEFRLGT